MGIAGPNVHSLMVDLLSANNSPGTSLRAGLPLGAEPVRLSAS